MKIKMFQSNFKENFINKRLEKSMVFQMNNKYQSSLYFLSQTFSITKHPHKSNVVCFNTFFDE